MEKSGRWQQRMPFSQSLSIERLLRDIKQSPSYVLRGTTGFARRAAHHAKTSRMVQGLLKRLP